MADGTYERRGPREAELKRLARIIAEAGKKSANGEGRKPPADARPPLTLANAL